MKKNLVYVYHLLLCLMMSSIIMKVHASDLFDAIDIRDSTLRHVHACVSNKHKATCEIKNNKNEVIMELFNFNDEKCSVIIPKFKASSLNFKTVERRIHPRGKIQSSSNHFAEQYFSLLKGNIKDLALNNIIFSGSGKTGSVSLLLATLLQHDLPQAVGKVKVIVFSPSPISDKTFIKNIYKTIEQRNILFFKRKTLMPFSKEESFPGVPIEILPWEDTPHTLLKSSMFIPWIYTAYKAYHSLAVEKKSLSDSPRVQYAFLASSFFTILQLLKSPYIPSEETLRRSFNYCHHRWEQREEGFNHRAFSNEQEALVQVGKVTLTDPIRNSFIRLVLKTLGGY